MSVHETTESVSYLYTPQPDTMELIHQTVGLTCVTILGILFGIKSYEVEYKFLSLAKLLVLLLYICSWAFIFSGLPIIASNNGNFVSCTLASIGCDIFYTGTKIFIYSWLIEKVWIVGASNEPRLRSKSYRFHLLLLVPYAGIIIFLLITHITRITSDGTCIIGFHIGAAYLILIYDFIINLYMTILFVRPLMKMHKNVVKDHRISRLQDVAKRTLVASVVCLIVSSGNIFLLILFNAEARGALCLTCCFLDVIINNITIHWVTSQPNGRKGRHDTSDLKNTSLTTDNNASQSHSNNNNSSDSHFNTKSKSGIFLKEDHEVDNFEFSENPHQPLYQTSLSPSPPLASNQVPTYTQTLQHVDSSDQQHHHQSTITSSSYYSSPLEEFDMKAYKSTNHPSSTFNPYNHNQSSTTITKPTVPNENFANININEYLELHSPSRRSSSFQESYSTNNKYIKITIKNI
ncbi:unnamed protein product [Cunninghamella echinulata]